MRLDELICSDHGHNSFRIGGKFLSAYLRPYGYDFYVYDGPSRIGKPDIYERIDAPTAQAILFELTKPCPVADPS